MQHRHFQPAQPKGSSGKYVVIAFVVILIVIYLVFSGDKNTAPVESVNETVTETQPSQEQQELVAQKAELERQSKN